MESVAIAEQLGRSGLCVWPNFLIPAALREVRADFDLIQAAQGFHRAGTGQGGGNGVRDQVRSDTVHWLDREPYNPAQDILWRKFDGLQQAFNRTLFLGLSRFNGHYAAYPEGGFYRRHLDCFAHDDARVVSVILYLNRDWKFADGGQLRVFDTVAHTDIDPVGGTLVCFLSAQSEHEVLPSHGARASFTGWFER